MKLWKTEKNRQIFLFFLLIILVFAIVMCAFGLLTFSVARDKGLRDVYRGNLVLGAITIGFSFLTLIFVIVCIIRNQKLNHLFNQGGWRNYWNILFLLLLIFVLVMFLLAVFVLKDKNSFFYFDHGIWKKWLI